MGEVSRKCEGRLRVFGYCERPPTIEREGKFYCWQHDPERAKKIADKKLAARKAEIARIEQEVDERTRKRILFEKAGLDRLTVKDAQAVIARGGFRTMLDDHDCLITIAKAFDGDNMIRLEDRDKAIAGVLISMQYLSHEKGGLLTMGECRRIGT